MKPDREEVRRRIERFTPEEMAQFGYSTVDEAVEAAMNMDVEKIRREAAEALTSEESLLEEVVASAREFLAREEDRVMGLSSFYGESLQQVNSQDLSADRLFNLLIIAVWQLAEAQDREEKLLDGTRRAATKGE